MSDILRAGLVTQTSSGASCAIERLLGGGGQGEVYQATIGGSPVALKWYFPHTATPQQRSGLESLIKMGPPNARFLWPLDLATTSAVDGFGYVMPLRPARFKGILDLMTRRVEPSFRPLATAGFELADSFLQLHSRGLCYRDISFGNVFFDPDTGEVMICDNDNVTVNGDPNTTILGTARFMAPEIVRGEALPSTQTDLFSLAVLLFYMFCLHHPLDGAKEAQIHAFDAPAQRQLYGFEPVFVFDPNNASNRPVPGYHDAVLNFWPIYPQFLKDLFVKAFTDGIRDQQHGRVAEGIWRGAMIRLRDSIIYCANCGMENFYDADALRASGGRPSPCWACSRVLRLPPRIRIERNIIMLNHDTQLFPHHTDNRRPYDFSKPSAAVARHPSDPNIWGLRNLSSDRWVSTTAQGEMHDIDPGRSITLAVGTKVNFGTAIGEIRL